MAGIPFPDIATYLIGTLELVGGVALVVGLLVWAGPGRRSLDGRLQRRLGQLATQEKSDIVPFDPI